MGSFGEVTRQHFTVFFKLLGHFIERVGCSKGAAYIRGFLDL